MRAIAFILWALLLAGPVFSQRLEYYTTLEYGDAGGVRSPIALPSGRVIMPLVRDSVYRRGNRPCQDMFYQGGSGPPVPYSNRMLAVINPNGDTSRVISRPFHFKDILGGYPAGDRIYSPVNGSEPDSCWGGDTWFPPAGIRTLDTNGNVLDSISFINYWPGKRYYWDQPVYDRYGVTAICVDLDTYETKMGRFSYTGQVRYFRSLTAFPYGGGVGQFYPDVDGGYYTQVISRNMNAIARLDSNGNLRYFKELPPDYPAGLLHEYYTCLTADGGVAYAYQNGYFAIDSVRIIAKDRFENRRYTFKFRGDIKEMLPLSDNSLLVFRTLIWDSTSTIRPYIYEVIRLDSLGQVTWRQQLLPRPTLYKPGIASSVFSHIYGDGSCFFNFVAVRYDLNRPNHSYYYPVYGHISGVARYNPDAAKEKLRMARLTLYPNPARGQVRMAGLTKAVGAAVYASDGRMLRESIAVPDKPYDVSFLSPGMYLIKLEDGRTARLAIE